jgi:chemotaxis protein methyltransferase CheR
LYNNHSRNNGDKYYKGMTITSLDLQQFVNAIRNYSSYDLSEYSDKSLNRRLVKVLTDYKLELPALLSQMRTNPRMIEDVVKDITVNTTELFRDPHIWQHLKYVMLPKLKNQQSINIWHAGCSTGQEVYSLMIMLNELGMLDKAKIYASDLNTDVLQIAKNGQYKYRFNIAYLDNFDKALKENPFNYEEYFDVPYSKYFDIDKEKDLIKMHPFLTEKPVFKKHDLVKDGNIFFTKFDLIVCRNVIIYFNYELQNKVFELFNNSLFPNSYLWLGMHESIMGPHSTKFEKNAHFYMKREAIFSS